MSIGRMNTFIDIIEVENVKDKESFSITNDKIIASVRAYMEGKSGTVRWANRASFTSATVLFRFRVIPGIKVTTKHVIVCCKGRFKIENVEDVNGRKMYIEILARKDEPNGENGYQNE